jgi:hypothetical protein
MGSNGDSRVSVVNGSGTDRLTGWKQIAAYVDREPRTVQLWEKHEGFPVRRLAHQSGSSIYAYTEEIDAWLQSRSVEGNAGILTSMKQAVRRTFFGW